MTELTFSGSLRHLKLSLTYCNAFLNQGQLACWGRAPRWRKTPLLPQISPRLCWVTPKGLYAHSCRSRPLAKATWCSLWCFCDKTNSGGFLTCFPAKGAACLWSRWTTAIVLMAGEPAEPRRKESWAVCWRWAQAWERCSGTTSPAPWTVGSGACNKPFGEPKRLYPAPGRLLVPAECGGSSASLWHPSLGISPDLQPKGITVQFVPLCASVSDVFLFRHLLLLPAVHPGYVLTELFYPFRASHFQMN